jgi:O-antigen ligase
MLTRGLPRPLLAAALALFAAVNVAVGAGLATGRMAPAILLAAVPALLVGVGALAKAGPYIFFCGFILETINIPAMDDPLPIGAGGSIFVADLVLLVALASFAATALTTPAEERPRWLRSPLYPPLVLFAAFAMVGVWRGHEAYGASLIGQPLRIVLYAGIGAAMVSLKPQQAYRLILYAMYGGAVWQALAAVYHMASGTSVTATSELSTGGTRWLSIGSSWYTSGALALALLNLAWDKQASRRTLHMTIAVLALFDIVAAYSRGTFAAVGVLLVLLFVLVKGVRRASLYVLPLFLPAFVLLAIFVPKVAPDVFSTFEDRVFSAQRTDANVRWREEAYKAIYRQVEENPIVGVGFGKGATFTLDRREYDIPQDPHNSYLYLWAGGGIVTLGSFALLMLVYVVHAFRRLRASEGIERLLVTWALATWFVFMANAAFEPVLTQPHILIAIWQLMLIPALVRARRTEPQPAATT